jgi:hypothetical protein
MWSNHHDPALSSKKPGDGRLHRADQSTGHEAFLSEQHDPKTSWVHDGVR